ncbi:MAG: PAS domain-containing protein, partial [Desulfobacterales bacterium]
YLKIFRISEIGMSVYDASGQCIEANEAIGRLVGASREQALLQNYHHIESWKKSGILDTALCAVKENTIQHKEVSVTSTFGRHITINYHFIPFTVGRQKYLLMIASDVTERKKAEVSREKLVKELQKALSDVKTLKGIIPICASCKRVRDDKGYWEQIESYINKYSEADFSHGICPDCAAKIYPDVDS